MKDMKYHHHAITTPADVNADVNGRTSQRDTQDGENNEHDDNIDEQQRERTTTLKTIVLMKNQFTTMRVEVEAATKRLHTWRWYQTWLVNCTTT